MTFDLLRKAIDKAFSTRLNQATFLGMAHDRQASLGQAGMIMVSMIMVVFVMAVGLSLSQMSQKGAERTVVTKRSLQSYYVAMAGVQQALANRMYPASNYLSWNPVGGLTSMDPYPSTAVPAPPTDPVSGEVFQNPAAPSAATRVGVFQYFVLGGYQEVDAANSAGANFAFWPNGTLNAVGAPVKSAMTGVPPGDGGRFLIVSRAVTCRGAGANTVLGAINPNKLAAPGDPAFGFRIPTCAAGTQPDVMTMLVVAQVQADDGTADQIVSIRAYPRDTALPLPIRAFIPGAGWLNAGANINFDPVYAFGGGILNNPATPSHVVFYNFTTNAIQCAKTFNAAAITILPGDCEPGETINNRSVIKLFFKGPIDHRSIDRLSDFQLTNCRANPADCNIQMAVDTNPGVPVVWGPVTGYSFIYQPPYINQMIFLPNLSALPGANTLHQLQINTNAMRGWSGASGGGGSYTVNFTTAP